MKSYSFILAFVFLPLLLISQITGTITNQGGEPLPYVNVYVENTSIGTTTNGTGKYTLKLEPGTYNIIYQFIGFKIYKEKVSINERPIIKNVILSEESYNMPEVVISANAEDPAYEIIRKAQSKRKYYLDLSQNYECDAYVRGFNKILNAPEKILGIEVGDMDGALDSTRQGVVYLSESVSKLYSLDGKKKEVMFSSKISGNDQGYSFNSAKEMEFNFYENLIDLQGKKLISPIGSGAMSYYNYKLEGAQYDDNGQLFNKIKVTPKNEYAPAFQGYIYINEDLWNINSLELALTKKSIQQEFIDSLTFTQTFIPVSKDNWMNFSNVIRFRLGAFGFDVGGNFACVYSNYNMDNIDESVFNREVFKVEEEANQRTEMYWDSIRPIPLTQEEHLDYIRKDSIRIVRESPEYLDSIDQENNKFKLSNLLGSYSYQNSIKKSRWSISTPLTDVNVNTIQGWNGSFGFSYSKSYNENRTKRLSFTSKLNYGLSEKVLRPNFTLRYLANRKNNLQLRVSGGRDISQVNRLNPISDRLNSIMTYFFRRNYLKAYDKKYASLTVSQNLGAVFAARLSVDYEDRSSLVNNYDNSLYYKNSRIFTRNIPSFNDHKLIILRASLRIRIGEELWSYPDRTFRSSSDWPTIWLHYKQGINVEGGNSYQLLHASINKTYTIGLFGNLSFYIHGGFFIDEPDFFIDRMHFLGNQTHVGYPSDYGRRFLMLPYYSHSTSSEFIQMHLHHNFEGALLGKLPIFKQLGWHLSGGVKYLKRSLIDHYHEFHVGLDNLGWGIYRLFRVDAVWNNWDNSSTSPIGNNSFGIVVGIDIDL